MVGAPPLPGRHIRSCPSPSPVPWAHERRSFYKACVDAEDGRCRREDRLVEIHKNTSEPNLLKKCRNGFSAAAASTTCGSSQMGGSSLLQQRLEGMPAMVQLVLLDYGVVQLEEL